MLKQGIADIGHDFFAKPHDIVESDSGTYRQKQDNGYHHGKVLVHQCCIGGCETMVDDPPHGNGNKEGGHRSNDECYQG